MTLKEFIKILSGHKGEFYINITDSGCKRIRSNKGCPIVFVFNSLNINSNLSSWQFHTAAKSLGLTSKTTRRIVNAADDNKEEFRLRNRLLKAVDLKKEQA